MILTRIYGYGCLVLLCGCVLLFGLWQHADAELARYQAKAGQDQVGAVAEANKRVRDLQRKLDSLPKAEGSIREVVRQNPAVCDRPAPVADGLSEAIRAANAARKVPADS